MTNVNKTLCVDSTIRFTRLVSLSVFFNLVCCHFLKRVTLQKRNILGGKRKNTC